MVGLKPVDNQPHKEQKKRSEEISDLSVLDKKVEACETAQSSKCESGKADKSIKIDKKSKENKVGW